MDRRWVKTSRPVAKLREGRNDWYRIENKTSDSADVYIYDEIGYWGVTASDFVKELDALDVGQIALRVNSPGGEVFDGVAIYEALKRNKATVTAYVDGLAASAASFIVQAADRIVMSRNSTMMIHEASGLVIGNSQDMRELANLLDKLSENIADIYTQRAGNTVSYWRDKMKAETWYNAQEAVDDGLADEVSSSDDGKASNSWDLSIYNYRSREEAPAPQVQKKYEIDTDALSEALKEAFR